MTLKQTIQTINRLRKELDKLRPLSGAQERRLNQKIRLEWNYHSNAIEGNQLNYGETRAFLLHGITAKGKPFKDYLDIRGHDEAIDYMVDLVNNKEPLTEAAIRKLHETILVEPYETDAITADGKPTKKQVKLGEYKKMPNHVKTSSGDIHYYASPEETPARMNDLMDWYREATKKNELHPVEIAASFHYEFVNIHPFDDGNGRLARILMNLILMQYGYPPVVIKKGDRETYFLALEQADADDLEEFFDFIGRQVIDSLQLSIDAAKGKPIEESEDIDKKLALLDKKMEQMGKKEVKIKRSKQAQIRIYKKSLEPMISKLIQQLGKLDKYFMERQLCLVIDGTKEEHVKKRLFERLSGYLSTHTGIKTIEFEYYFNGFKKSGTTAFPMVFKLKIFFGQFKYTLKSSQGDLPVYEKLYDEYLTEAEIDHFASMAAEYVIEKLEERVKKL